MANNGGKRYHVAGESYFRRDDAVAKMKRIDFGFSEAWEKIAAVPGLEAALPILEDAFILTLD